jgi:RNA polymerase sigma-70 factor (ECF subfamily)
MPKDYSDNTVLLASLKEQDLRAFDYLYNSTRNRLLVLAYAIVKDEEAARDMVQDFFLDFWDKELYKDIQESLKYYLTRSIRNRAINYIKKQKVVTQLKVRMPVTEEAVEIHLLENEELKMELNTAIEKLPTMAGKVFRLHYIEFRSHAEIADLLGISKSTVSSHIDRALKELRNELKKGE